MTIFAEFTLNPGGLISWLIVGLIAGYLAGNFMGGGGFGIIGDIVVGLLGAVIGGSLFGMIVLGSPNFFGSILVAFMGACVLILILRLLTPNGRAI